MSWGCVAAGFVGYCLGAFVDGFVKAAWAAHRDGSEIPSGSAVGSFTTGSEAALTDGSECGPA